MQIERALKMKEPEDSPLDQLLHDWAAVLPDVDITAFSIQVRIAQLHALAVQATDRIAAAHAINHIDLRLLLAIKRSEQGRPIRPSDLWRRFDIAPSAITRRVDRLHGLGLVARIPDPTDRRALHVQLTDRGQETIIAIVTAFHEVTRRHMTKLGRTPGAAAQLNDLLAVLARDWESAAQPD